MSAFVGGAQVIEDYQAGGGGDAAMLMEPVHAAVIDFDGSNWHRLALQLAGESSEPVMATTSNNVVQMAEGVRRGLHSRPLLLTTDE